MKTIANIYAKKISSDSLRPGTVAFRSRMETSEGWISIIVNSLLFAIKLTLGLISLSIALIADAFHSLSDLSSSIIIIVSAKIFNFVTPCQQFLIQALLIFKTGMITPDS